MLRSKVRPAVSARRDIPLATLVTGTFLGLLTLLLVSGCAEKSAVQAEDREVPLTAGDDNNQRPYFSPDGENVLFTSLLGQEGMSGTEVKMVSASGGEPRIVTPEPHQIGRGWDPVQKSIMLWNGMEREVRWVTDDGTLLRKVRAPEMSYFQNISRDGEQILFRQFTGDNHDMGMTGPDGADLKILRATPQWEIQACFGPGPGEITVVRQDAYSSSTNQIFVLAPNGSETELPLTEAKLRSPVWSPNGAYMAYASDESGNMDLWVYDAGTRRTVQLTGTPEDEANPSWSPDGEWVVFSRSKQTASLFLGDQETFSREPLTKAQGEDTNPWVSPDGNWVAFYRKPPKEKDGILCVASLPDGEVKEYRLANITPTLEQWPITWSPDASEVAIPADDGSGNVDIYRVGLADGRARRVTITAGVDTNPRWSPDGRSIAYIRMVEGGIQVWTIPATGGIPVKISRIAGMNVLPCWSPDSRQLAWASEISRANGGGDEVELWVASVEDPDQAHRVDVELPPGRGSYPIYWSKDGKSLLVQRLVDEGILFYSVAADGSDTFLAATVGKEDRDDFLEFTEKGKVYKDVCLPGGMHVFSDGEEISNIFKIRVPEIMEARLQADGGLN